MAGYPLLAHFDAPTVEARLRIIDLVLDMAPPTAVMDATLSRVSPVQWGRESLEERTRLPASDREVITRFVRSQAEADTLCSLCVYNIDEDAPAFDATLDLNPIGSRPGFVGWQVPHDIELEINLPVQSSDPQAPMLPMDIPPQQRRLLSMQLCMLDLIERSCRLHGVERGYVFVEQRVFNPLSYRLMFQASPERFADDLRDVVEIALRGGAAYPSDERRHLEPLVGQRAASIDFCDRSREEVASLRARTERALPELDRRGVPAAVPEDLIREAAARSGRYAVFSRDDGGLGVRGLPVRTASSQHNFDQFPVVFLDEFYLDLAELVLA